MSDLFDVPHKCDIHTYLVSPHLQVRLLPLAVSCLPVQPLILTVEDLRKLCVGCSDGSVPALPGRSSIPPSLAPTALLSDDDGIEAGVATTLCQLDEAATVIIGPGCKIHSNK